jgi:transposase
VSRTARSSVSASTAILGLPDVIAPRESGQPRRERRQPVRRPLPDHLTREEIVHHPGSVCPGCGGTRFSKIGEDVTEVLEKIPARLKVIRHIRPKLSCRSCERIAQAPTPDLPIEKGRPGPGLVANVVVGKYLDGLPLYHQSAILAREGIAIERATLADWVGHVAWWVMPLAELIGAQVMAAPVIHTDDTPIAVLAPGNGKTRTGRLWAYVVDERPWQGVRLPAAYYRFSPDRRGERPRDHLAGFRGVIQADAFSGYGGPGTLGGIGQRTNRPRAAAADPRRLLGARPAQVLRRVRGNQVAARRGGAEADRRTLRNRGQDRRPAGRSAAGCPPELRRADP